MKEITIDGVTYILTPKEKKMEHDYVNLGLPSGRLWATCNIGAEKPTECGDYFAWGTTDPYNLDDCNTDGYENTEAAKLTKMDDAHDAAKVLWGEEWCIPTLTDFAELIDSCDYYSKRIDGILCGIFSSKTNDNKLILLASGNVCDGSLLSFGSNGYYWSRSHIQHNCAWMMSLAFGVYYVGNTYRYNGFPIRPVKI